MSDSTDTPSEHAPEGDKPAAPASAKYEYVVKHAGFGPAVGEIITDDARIQELGLATASWANRRGIPAEG